MLSFAISEVVLAIQFLVCSEPELGEWKKEIHSEQRLIQSHFLEIPFERFFIQFFVHNHRKRDWESDLLNVRLARQKLILQKTDRDV